MREQLRRFWQALLYDPQVEYQRAKDLLKKRLASPELENEELRKPKLRLWKSHRPRE
jgi:uncharacterized membrane protein